VLGVVVVLFAILAIPLKEWITQRSRIADLEAQVAWHDARVAELEAAKARWDDPAYIEAQARTRLHFVRPGEVGWVVQAEEVAKPEQEGSNRPMARPPKGWPWWNAAWSSVEQVADPESGRPPDAAEPAQGYGR
jgi:hypothetical protein